MAGPLLSAQADAVAGRTSFSAADVRAVVGLGFFVLSVYLLTSTGVARKTAIRAGSGFASLPDLDCEREDLPRLR